MNAIGFVRALRPMVEDASGSEPVLSIANVFHALRRRWAEGLVVALVLAALGGVVSLSLPRWYAAEALVLFQARQTQVSDLQAFNTGTGHDPNFIKTQSDLLTARATAQAAAAALGLERLPEFQPQPGLFGALLASLGLRDAAVLAPPERLAIATDLLMARTRVSMDQRSNVVRLTVEARSARLAAELANAIVEQVIAGQAAAKRSAVVRTQAWLTQQVEDQAQRLRAAEAAVENYRAQHGLTESRGQAGGRGTGQTNTGTQMGELSTQLSQAVSERLRREAAQAGVQGILRGEARIESLPAVVDAPLVQRLLEREAVMAAREAELASILGRQHPDMLTARAQLRSIQAEKAAAMRNLASSLAATATAARNNEAALRQRLEGLRVQAEAEAQLDAELRRLVAEAEAQRAVYTAALARMGQLANSAAIQETNAELVSAAIPPLQPAYPRRVPMLLLVLAGAVLAGAAAALLADRLTRGYLTAAELEADLDIPALGLLPEVQLWGGPMPHRGYSRRLLQGAQEILAGLAANAGNGGRVVVVTSSGAGEGRTTLAISLAVMAAAGKQKVVLVDAEIGGRQGANWPAGGAEPSLAGYLADGGSLEGMRCDSAGHLMLLPAGGAVPNPAQALASDRMAMLLGQLRAAHDLIIIDAPPAGDPAQVTALARQADEVVLAVRFARTRRHQVRDALRRLGNAGAAVTGVVLTRAA